MDEGQEVDGKSAAGGTPENEGLTFESWIGAQPDAVRGLVDTHVGGLKNALNSEREQRKELQKALKDATKALEDGTEARTRLEGLSGKLEAYEQQIGAYDALQAAGVSNLKLAYIAAREAGAVDKSGQVAMETLKAAYPELFIKKVAVSANAGTGSRNGVPAGTDVNAQIRRAAGR
jgi:hypothetical protein